MISYSLLTFLLPSLVFAADTLVKLDYTSYNGTALPNGITQWLGVRYAAPPLGSLRFAAPQDPLHNSTVQKADKHGLLCLSTPGSLTSNTTSEDCLFLEVYAPSNATTDSKLPVFFFIQGGGFNSNSNPNLNGSDLITAADMDMVIINFNYRVGLFGFLAGQEVKAGGSINNGLKDQRKALEWVSKYIEKFGGDPDHVVIGGDSAGAASVTLLLTAYGGRDDHLFVGAAAESQSFANQYNISESQWMYDNLIIRTECIDAENGTLECLRSRSVEELQKVNFNIPFPTASNAPLYMYGPTIDGELVPDYTYKLFSESKIIMVPTLFGDASNDGTIFTPKTTSNISNSDTFLRDQFPALTIADLAEINSLYPKTNDTFPDSGSYWRQVSNAYGEMRYLCPGIYCSSAYTNASIPSWVWRYNVLDPEEQASGLGVPHTIEVNAIWGPDSIYGGGAPKSYYTTNKAIIPVIQGYWTSFIRTLDPNKLRAEGSPVWEQWTKDGTWRRLKFQTNATEMENVDAGQKTRCEFLSSIGVSLRQ